MWQLNSRSVRVVAERQPDGVTAEVTQVERRNGDFEYLLSKGVEPDALLRSFLDAGISIERFEVALPTLSEIFVEEVSNARDSNRN